MILLDYWDNRCGLTANLYLSFGHTTEDLDLVENIFLQDGHFTFRESDGVYSLMGFGLSSASRNNVIAAIRLFSNLTISLLVKHIDGLMSFFFRINSNKS